MKLYVGNLPFSATETELRELFGNHGTVDSINLITDRDTGRPRGFGFVEMTDGGEAARNALNGTAMGERNLTVDVAKKREERGGERNRW